MDRGEVLLNINKDEFSYKHSLGSGKGGQKRNKTETACHCFHISGINSYSDKTRSKHLNKLDSFYKIFEKEKFRDYIDSKIEEEYGPDIIWDFNIFEYYAQVVFLSFKKDRKEFKRKPSYKNKTKEDRRKSKINIKKYY